MLKSEEFVLGSSSGFVGEKDTKFAGIESTKICIVAPSGKRGWNGFTSVEHSIGNAKVGEAMVGKQFPARCLVSYQRVTAESKTMFEGRETTRDVEKLVVVGIEYLSPVDLVDVKVQSEKKVA